MIAATKNKYMTNNILYVSKLTDTVTYGEKQYRIQNDRGHNHIVVRKDGLRTKITVKEKKVDYNVFFHYYLEGLSITHPCLVMDWWLEMSTKKRIIPIGDFVRPVSFF